MQLKQQPLFHVDRHEILEYLIHQSIVFLFQSNVEQLYLLNLSLQIQGINALQSLLFHLYHSCPILWAKRQSRLVLSIIELCLPLLEEQHLDQYLLGPTPRTHQLLRQPYFLYSSVSKENQDFHG